MHTGGLERGNKEDVISLVAFIRRHCAQRNWIMACSWKYQAERALSVGGVVVGRRAQT